MAHAHRPPQQAPSTNEPAAPIFGLAPAPMLAVPPAAPLSSLTAGDGFAEAPRVQRIASAGARFYVAAPTPPTPQSTPSSSGSTKTANGKTIGCPFFAAGQDRCKEVFASETAQRGRARCEDRFTSCFYYFERLNAYRQRLAAHRSRASLRNVFAHDGTPTRRAA